MKESKNKSVIPIYGVAAVWVLYCLIFPLYLTWHFFALACSAVLTYTVLARVFPGRSEQSEEENIDDVTDKIIKKEG